MPAILVLILKVMAIVTIGGNFAIERYADWKTAQMAKIAVVGKLIEPKDREDDSTEPPWTVTQLRKTICQGSGVVENLEYRNAWNQWLTTASPATKPNSIQILDPGVYRFAYRSYVNYEEAGAIRKRLWHLPTLVWGYVQPTPGVVIIAKKDTINDAALQQKHQISAICKEFVRFRWRTILYIEWTGHWDPPTKSLNWTSSKMIVYKRKLKWWNVLWKPLSVRDV
ncbi:hypothetical protein IV203_032753 [Nitzschia inconspicua]|uniref:Uncharacterized protein n=1 Tax=Nitzschia inconspicua TaxID=303405 RepID=A0A9K3PF42_9STRA|nr:hypothetical protein IV203_032753 [Nitzschia inconspicua]